MAAYEYAALDARGRTKRGVMEGDTPRQVRQQLRDQALTPLEVNEVASRQTSPSQRKTRGGHASVTDLALMTRQLATLIRAGLAVEECLRAVAEQTEKARMQSMLMAVRARILEGHSLAEGLALYPAAFSELYRATVAAGEQAGRLEIVLERLADYMENRQQVRQKTLLALFYPMILTGVALLVVVALLTYVVPQVVQVFANTNQELPWLTKNLIMVSEFLQTWGIWLFLVLVAAALVFQYLLRYESVLTGFHRVLLNLPLISKLERGSNVARFTRTLSILSASGVPLLDALNIASEVTVNRPMRRAVEAAAKSVREGSSLNNALKQSGLFPPMTLYLIASGETSGNLEEMLERAAINQEQELDTLTSVLLNLFEPILILVMGGIVLVIVLAVLLPIFELNQLVR
ncbi:MAG: type II secretion system inner membrane protein GspF [Pseudomonadota bacterium]